MKKSTVSLTVTAAIVASALGLSACEQKEEPPVCVYGPPSEFTEEIEPPQDADPGSASGNFDEDEPVQDVYGPPVEE